MSLRHLLFTGYLYHHLKSTIDYQNLDEQKSGAHKIHPSVHVVKVNFENWEHKNWIWIPNVASSYTTTVPNWPK